MADDPLLDDGDHDAIVVDVDDRGDGTVGVDLTVVSGPAKGEVVTVLASDLAHDPLDLLGLPATITVRGGDPTVRFER